jgi:hypothetical protein
VEAQSLRLWSIHPKYLDRAGLAALWRESLLAQKVLKGETKGYVNHPQILRFKDHPYPLIAISRYLLEVWKESRKRGYDFDCEKIGKAGKIKKIKVTEGQLRYEFNLLRGKLKKRDSRKHKEILFIRGIESHPLFRIIKGRIESWERINFDRKI